MPELKISMEVNADDEQSVEAVPAAGKDLYIFMFAGSASFSQNAVVKLTWDYDGAKELIWTIKGEAKMPFEHTIPAAQVDGVKKLAVSLENTGTGPVYLSGFAEYKELG